MEMTNMNVSVDVGDNAKAMPVEAGKPFKPFDWELLARLDTSHNAGELSPIGENNYHELLDETRNQQEHPENYSGACFCYLCRSYANDSTTSP
jgi:hypothetical protein